MPEQTNLLPVADWLPDQPALNNPGITVCLNVFPKSKGSYGPVPYLKIDDSVAALPEPPLAAYSFMDANRRPYLFVGTATKLWSLTAGQGEFRNITKPGARYTTSEFNRWNMTSFGNSIIATNGIDPVQVYSIGYDETFHDLNSDFAPRARYLATVRDFLVLAYTEETNVPDQNPLPTRIHWSAIGDPSTWPLFGTAQAAQLQSDVNDFPTHMGHITGIASNLQTADVCIIFQHGVYSGKYQGSPAIFSFYPAQGSVGCRSPSSIVAHRGFLYFLGQDGFYAMDGTTPHAIGADKIDKFFLNDPIDGLNERFYQSVHGSADPTGRLIQWLYVSKQSMGTPDRLLIYNWHLDRWSLVRINADLIAKSMTFGLTLEELDAFCTPGLGIESLPYSLDSPVWEGGVPEMWAFNKDHRVCTFTGPNLAATVTTTEAQPTFQRRSRVTGVRPLVDTTTPPTTRLGSRNQQTDLQVWNQPTTPGWYGECPHRVDARYFRVEIKIPVGSQWSHLLGAELSYRSSTRR